MLAIFLTQAAGPCLVKFPSLWKKEGRELPVLPSPGVTAPLAIFHCKDQQH